MQNELKREKEFVESFNKPSEAIRYFEQLLKSPRSSRDTVGLGYISIEEGESLKLLSKGTIKARILNLLVITMERKEIHLMFVEVSMQRQKP